MLYLDGFVKNLILSLIRCFQKNIHLFGENFLKEKIL
jgi:hypothetical protein